MNLKTVDDHTVADVKRMIVETGTPHVLCLVADLARQHAEDLLNAGCTRGSRQICARPRCSPKPQTRSPTSDDARVEAGEAGLAC